MTARRKRAHQAESDLHGFFSVGLVAEAAGALM
jgi:hypothetical protein